MEYVTQLVIVFALYSFVGWCGEVVYTFLRERRWVNRGFLSGPFFLLYGVGAIVPVILCSPHDNLWQVLAIAMVWSAIVEYGGSLLLEHIGLSYWDYSDKPYNLHGRICLESIGTFVAGILALVYVFNPPIMVALVQSSPTLVSLVSMLFVIYAVADGYRKLQSQLAWHRQTGAIRTHITR